MTSSSRFPLVSGIVPFYNAAKTIEESLKSIARIQYPNLQVIFVNDGSTDESEKLVNSFLHRQRKPGFDPLLIRNEENQGPSHAKNLGMEKATGEFFFIAAADDLQHPDRVNLPLKYLKENQGVDIVYFDCEVLEEADGSNILSPRGFPQEMNNDNLILHQIRRSHLWSGMFLARSSLACKFDESLSSAVDYDWFFRLHFEGKVAHFIRESLLTYRIHGHNLSKDHRESQANAIKTLRKYDFESLHKQLRKTLNEREVDLAFAWRHLALSNYEEALSTLIEIKPAAISSEAVFLTGVCLFKLGRITEASDRFEESCAKFPQKCEGWNNLAVCRSRLGTPPSILEEQLSKAIDINPRYLDAQKNLAVLRCNPLAELKLTMTPLRDRLIHSEHYLL